MKPIHWLTLGLLTVTTSISMLGCRPQARTIEDKTPSPQSQATASAITNATATSDTTNPCFPWHNPALNATQKTTIIGLDQGNVVWNDSGKEIDGCFRKTSGEWSRLYDVSPSGLRLLTGFSLNELFALQLTDSSAKRLTPEAADAIWLDENTFMVWNNSGDLWSARNDDGEPCRVASGVKSAAYCANSGWLAIERQPGVTAAHKPGLYLLDVTQNTQETVLLTDEIATKWGIAGPHILWDSKCEHILFPINPTEPEQEVSDYLAMMNVETREIRRLRVQLPSGPLYLSTSGNRLFYNSEGLDRPTVTWIIDLDWSAGTATTAQTLPNTLVLEGANHNAKALLRTEEGVQMLNLDDLTLQPIQMCNN